MLSIDIRHPDVEKFINIKKDLTKVTGANISILIRDDFMEAVKTDSTYVLQWPCNSDKPSVTKEVKAKEVWDQIIAAAHGSAEPGIIFVDKHWNNSPDSVYPTYKGITTNP